MVGLRRLRPLETRPARTRNPRLLCLLHRGPPRHRQSSGRQADFFILLGSPLAGAAPQTPISQWTGLLNLNRFGLELLLYGFLFGITGVIQAQVHAHLEGVRSLELQRQLSAAQLRALQMQLEPHFLFNTLNAITTLVELGRQQEAAEMLGHLNALLQSTLKRTTPEKVPLSQELEIVENYLAIEQVRFADRLRIEIKVEPGTLDSLVPCFLLQPIVENAIRHGIAQCESNGLVEASASATATSSASVRDTGSRFNGHAKPGNGIGLRNTRERLAHFYHDNYDMNAQPIADRRLQCRHRHPLRAHLMKLKALIADDEPLARERLRFLLSHDEDTDIAGECRNGREVIDALKADPCTTSSSSTFRCPAGPPSM